MSKTLADYGIEAPFNAQQRVTCPLCQAAHSLWVGKSTREERAQIRQKLLTENPGKAMQQVFEKQDAEDTFSEITEFGCVSCGEGGSVEQGWHEAHDLEQGYIDPSSADVVNRIVAYYQKGKQRGLNTGLTTLDEFFTIKKKELTVFSGTPGAGKSEFIDQLAFNSSVAHKWRWAYYSPENEPLEEHLKKLIEKFVGKPFFGPDRMTEAERDRAMAFIQNHFYWIKPKGGSVEEVLSRVEYLRRKKLIDGFIGDPFNEFEHHRPPHLREDEYISQLLSKMRRFARKTDIAFWLVVHPRKMGKTDGGKQEVPTPYDLKGSSEFYAKADNILTVWRDITAEAYDREVVELHIQKVRFKSTGRAGEVVKLWYNYMNGIYREQEDRVTEIIPAKLLGAK